MRFCDKCGVVNQGEANYCFRCGRSFFELSSKPRVRRSTFAATVIIIILLGVIGDILTSEWNNNDFAEAADLFQPAEVSAKSAAPMVVSSLPAQPTRVSTPAATAPANKRSLTAAKTVKKHPASPKKIQLTGMVLIPGGQFIMGSPDGTGLQSEHPQHEVKVDAFYMDKYLVTFDQYDHFCDATGRTKPEDLGFGRGTRPVIGVSWTDANAYAKWMGKRLPTEAEYERAARGGTDSLYFFGNDMNQLGDYAWYNNNSNNMTHPVGEKAPNPYGLYDILGNVDEWCSDWYGDGYYAVNAGDHPHGPNSGTERVIRGGSWWGSADFLFCGKRSGADPVNSYRQNGFRCVSLK